MAATSAVRKEAVRVCAWCGVDLDTGLLVPKTAADAASHGVCQACAPLLEMRKVNIREILEKIPGPMFFLDREGRVRAANQAASVLVDAPLAEIENELCGDVLECMHASLPGGCGRTDHCNGCTIRNTAMRVLNTGEPAVDESTYSFHVVDGRATRRNWLVSAERYGAGVIFAIRPA